MNRQFGEKDRAKKRARIVSKSASATPGDTDGQLRLETAIKAALDDGFLPCATAFGIARKLSVPLTNVGDATDSLGVRITNCQLGCFKVDKSIHDDLDKKAISQKALEALDVSLAQGPLTCLGVFHLAKQTGLPPMDVADAANSRHAKIHDCQLGCW